MTDPDVLVLREVLTTAWWVYPNSEKHTEDGQALAAELRRGDAALDRLVARLAKTEWAEARAGNLTYAALTAANDLLAAAEWRRS